jgi:glycosyltransferase involved in cell wall biosynthesis
MTATLLNREWDSIRTILRTVPKPVPRAADKQLQNWIAKDGLWCQDGWIKPGYHADPPQFAPLPGERLSTPAFPASDFQAKTSTDKIDVVISLSAGSRHNDAELRYCLRSIERHFEELGQVWIVGHKPTWLRGVRHMPFGDRHRSKDVNIIRKIAAACRSGLSDRFVFWSDDQVLLRPLVWPQLGPYVWRDLAAKPANGKRWHRRLLATRDWLASRGLPTMHGDTHVPIPMDRKKFLELVSGGGWDDGDGLTVGTWYVNQTGTDSPTMGDRKATLEGLRSMAQTRAAVAGRWFLGYNDAGFTSDLRAVLDELFPEKCRWEESTIRVKPSGPTLSIIIPTIGRETLARTLKSVADQQLVEGDEVLLVQDGPADESVQRVFEKSELPGRYLGLDRHYGDFGATPRNHGIAQAVGDYLAFHDDDDTYRPGAFDAIRRAIERHPGRPMMFRNWVTAWGRSRWEDQTVRAHNVGTPMFVVPNDPGRLDRWPSHRGSDFAFIHETLRKWPEGSVAWQPEVLSDYLEPGSPEPRSTRRNLLYHIYPVAANDEWRLNVDRLLRYWDRFNGRKLVGIVFDATTVPVEAVQSVFPDGEIEWLVAANDSQLGERITFAEGLRRLRTLNPDEATFYAHAKGVMNTCGHPRLRTEEQRANLIPSVRRWRNLMYDHCLNWSAANLDRIIRRCSAAGCFQREGDVGKTHWDRGDIRCYWYYAGTFFWFNHMAYFGHHHPVRLRRNRWAAEYHLGSMFPIEKTHNFLVYPRRFNGRFYGLTPEEWSEIAPDPG